MVSAVAKTHDLGPTASLRIKSQRVMEAIIQKEQTQHPMRVLELYLHTTKPPPSSPPQEAHDGQGRQGKTYRRRSILSGGDGRWLITRGKRFGPRFLLACLL